MIQTCPNEELGFILVFEDDTAPTVLLTRLIIERMQMAIAVERGRVFGGNPGCNTCAVSSHHGATFIDVGIHWALEMPLSVQLSKQAPLYAAKIGAVYPS